MRSPAWRAAASLAGPAGTLLVLILLAAGTRLPWPQPLGAALAVLAFLQATALLLNLLPVLDGFGAIRPFLPRRWDPAIHKAEGFSMILLIAVLLLVPGVGGAFFGLAALLATLFGVSGQDIVRGFDAFQFWR
jgi:Peptidase family M50.